jgi:SAM-dependent methyltransferase
MHELAQQIIPLYERHALQWDAARRRQPLIESGWLERFEGLLPLGASVLDLGCGGGDPIAVHFAKHGFNVTGIDSSETMVSLFRRRLPAAKALLGDMRALRLDRGFQGVLAWDSFFHLTHDDQRQMFEVFQRHSVPGALLMFTSGPEHGEAIGALEGEALYHASLSGTEYQDLLSTSGYTVVEHVVNDTSCGGRTVWLARQRP